MGKPLAEEVDDTELDEEVETDLEPEIEEETQVEAEEDPTEEESEDEVVVTIGDAPTPEEVEREAAPKWVQDLRKNQRELTRRNRELEEQLKAKEQTPVPVIGKKPVLADFEYDAEKFETALTAWHDRKRRADDLAAQQKAAEQEQAQAWNARLAAYEKEKATLKVKDFAEAEAVLMDMLDPTQKGILIHGSEKPSLVIYALGKNEARAKELAAIKDPVKFAFAVSKLESDVKVKNRKAPPAPETPVTGTGRISGSVDSTLERLRAEAEKTGNYTKVIQYKQRKREAKT